MLANIRMEYRKRIHWLVGDSSSSGRPVVLLVRERQIAARAIDVAEIQLGVRLRSRVRRAAADRCARRVERLCLFEVSELGVQPAKAVEEAMMNGLVADALGQRRALR